VHAPDLFQNVLAQSGVYVWGRRQVLPWFLQTSRTDQRYYLDCVNNRTERQQSEALARVLTARGFAHTYRAIPSRHEYEDWRERVVAGLRFLWFNVPPV
jgi:enterochelin esterase-like enzyme